jgi:hypothetical protein
MDAEHEEVLAQARRAAEQAVGQAQQRAEQLLAAARQRTAELDAESAAQRRQVEEDFDITMAARRSAAARALAEQEASSKAEAQRRITEADRRIAEATDVARRIVTEADQHATAQLAEAARRIEQLRMLRNQIAEQLLAARATLDHTVQQLEPLADESSTVTGVGS